MPHSMEVGQEHEGCRGNHVSRHEDLSLNGEDPCWEVAVGGGHWQHESLVVAVGGGNQRGPLVVAVGGGHQRGPLVVAVGGGNQHGSLVVVGGGPLVVV